MTAFLSRLFRCLALLLLVFATDAFPSSTLGCDAQTQASIGYDGTWLPASGYDPAPIPLAGEKGRQTARTDGAFAVFSKLLAADITANTPLALGLTDAGLEQFAQARGATIATGENWQATFLDALNDPNTTVHFNLDQVDVWQGVQRAASGQGGPTDWELLQIQQNPQSWDALQFWKGGQPAPNPFK